MKEISKHIEQIALKLSQGEDFQDIVKDIKVSEREKYLLNGRSLKILLLVLIQFSNLLKIGTLFSEEEE